MSYATEHVAKALRAAREQKGMSQRALSALSGVPQAHISKIEANSVDLRLSSLLALAHALDLDLALVPRKALPAVQSIARSAAKTAPAATQVGKELARLQQAAQRLNAQFDTPEMRRFQKQMKELSAHWQSLNREHLGKLRKIVESARPAVNPEVLKEISKMTAALRNSVVHAENLLPLPVPRPAYTLDEDDDA